jgi:hypothetical protein
VIKVYLLKKVRRQVLSDWNMGQVQALARAVRAEATLPIGM